MFWRLHVICLMFLRFICYSYHIYFLAQPSYRNKLFVHCFPLKCNTSCKVLSMCYLFNQLPATFHLPILTPYLGLSELPFIETLRRQVMPLTCNKTIKQHLCWNGWPYVNPSIHIKLFYVCFSFDVIYVDLPQG